MVPRASRVREGALPTVSRLLSDGNLRPVGQRDERVSEKEDLDTWFRQEVLPLEPALMRFLRRNWRDEEDLPDFRQELYANIYDSARKGGRPTHARAFIFTAARNMLISNMRRLRVIPIDRVADLGELNVSGIVDLLTPEREALGNEDLHRIQNALNRLPARCRETLWMRRIDGLSQKEVATALGIGERTVEEQMRRAMRQLVAAMLDGPAKLADRVGKAKAKAKAGAGK